MAARSIAGFGGACTVVRPVSIPLSGPARGQHRGAPVGSLPIRGGNPAMNSRVILTRRPVGWVEPSCFALEDCPEPVAEPGDVIVQAVYLSTDPYLRGRMNEGPSYAASFQLGQPIVSRVVARVIDSRHEGFAVGDFVWGFLDWAQRSRVRRGEGLQRIDPAIGRVSHAISVLGMPGLTAWVGIADLGRPMPGETVYISSAAGTVGQIAGQFARRMGARVVGSAGSDDKVDFLLGRCGFDAAFNYKRIDLDDALRTHCPEGIDVYFDNVGGTTLEAALRHARVGARFPVCGMISGYNALEDPGIRGLHALLVKRIQMTGFIIYDHVHQLPAYLARVGPWVRRGEVVFAEDIVQGIEQAPAALIGMLRGEAIGKRLVQVAPEAAA
jgi:NADPH-dependent curcumin reductase CurA